MVWGLTWLAVRLGLNDLPPMTFAGLRFLLAATILVPFVLFKRSKLSIANTHWQMIIYTGLLVIAIPYALQFWGQQFVPSGLTAVMFATMPMFTMVFAHLSIDDDPFTPRRFGGAALGIFGVGLIFSDQLSADSLLAFWGCVGFLVGSASQALAQVIIKVRGRNVDPILIATGQTAVGGVLLLMIGIASEGNPLRVEWTPVALLSLLYLSVFGSAIAFSLLYWLLRHVKVTTVTSIALAQSVVAVFAGWVVLGEVLYWTALAGSAAVLAGLGLIIVQPKDVGEIEERSTA
jgi:drug/metabolite transporter (DMT)-like permease